MGAGSIDREGEEGSRDDGGSLASLRRWQNPLWRPILCGLYEKKLNKHSLYLVKKNIGMKNIEMDIIAL